MKVELELYLLSLSIFIVTIFLFSINSVYAETLILQNSGNNIQFDIKFTKSENDKKFYSNNDLIIISLRNEKFLKVIGDIDGTRTLLFGYKTSKNNDMTSYLLKGNIRSANGIKEVLYNATFGIPTNVVIEKPIISNQQQKKLGKINLVSQSYSHAHKEDIFGFVVRTYNANLNSAKNSDNRYGYLSDVNISLKIVDPTGKMVKEFNGITEKKTGYYIDSFKIPSNFKTGTYQVIINATKDGYLSTNKVVWLHVLEPIINDHNNVE